MVFLRGAPSAHTLLPLTDHATCLDKVEYYLPHEKPLNTFPKQEIPFETRKFLVLVVAGHVAHAGTSFRALDQERRVAADCGLGEGKENK